MADIFYEGCLFNCSVRENIALSDPALPMERVIEAATLAGAHGLLHGKVLSVSHDAIVRDKPGDKSGDKPRGQEDSSSEPLGQELVFAARVSLDRTQMEVDDRVVNLSPGMAVTVEIKTGSRRMIEYLLSPLLKYRHESLRDR
jgi:hemolysin D